MPCYTTESNAMPMFSLMISRGFPIQGHIVHSYHIPYNHICSDHGTYCCLLRKNSLYSSFEWCNWYISIECFGYKQEKESCIPSELFCRTCSCKAIGNSSGWVQDSWWNAWQQNATTHWAHVHPTSKICTYKTTNEYTNSRDYDDYFLTYSFW